MARWSHLVSPSLTLTSLCSQTQLPRTARKRFSQGQRFICRPLNAHRQSCTFSTRQDTASNTFASMNTAPRTEATCSSRHCKAAVPCSNSHHCNLTYSISTSFLGWSLSFRHCLNCALLEDTCCCATIWDWTALNVHA